MKTNTIAQIYGQGHLKSRPRVFIRDSDVWKLEGGVETRLTSDGNAKTDLQFTRGNSAVTWQQGGIGWRVGLNGKGYRPVYVPADLNHVITYGQSRACGRDDTGSPTESTTQPFNNVSFQLPVLRDHYVSGGEWVYDICDETAVNARCVIRPHNKSASISGKSSPVKNAEYYGEQCDLVAEFAPLREGLFTPRSGGAYYAPETFASATCNALTYRTGQRFVGSIAGIGSTEPVELKAGETQTAFQGYDLSLIDDRLTGWATGPFATVIHQIRTAKRLADAEGLSYKVAAICYYETTSGTYGGGETTEIFNWLNDCAKILTSQVEDVVALVKSTMGGNQTTRRGDDITAISMHRGQDITYQNVPFVENGGRVYASFPSFAFTDHNPHFTPHETRAMTEKFAQTIHQVVFESEEWEPLRIRKCWNEGNDVYVQLHTQAQIEFAKPTSGGANNDNFDAANDHYGIGVWSANINGTRISRRVEIVGFDLIKITCASDPSSGSVRIGRDYLYYSNIVGQALGYLPDTYNRNAQGNSYEHRDWLLGDHQPVGELIP